MATRVILDTDIGTDVDDALALSLILTSPELKLEGVTCVYGDVSVRSKMTRKLLQLRGVEGVPVMEGMRNPLLNRRPIYWEGHEGKGLIENADDLLETSEFAVDYLVRTIMSEPGQIHLIAIGPLTNVAMAFLREPRLAGALAGLTIMGGVIRGERFELPFVEHNIKCDPEAAHIVFSSGAPITLVPLDITTQVRITPDAVRQIRAGGTAWHDAVAQQVETYPYFRSQSYTFLHDPLAVATLVDPTLVTTEPLHVIVELNGEHTAGATLMRHPKQGDHVVHVAMQVDIERFDAFLPARLGT